MLLLLLLLLLMLLLLKPPSLLRMHPLDGPRTKVIAPPEGIPPLVIIVPLHRRPPLLPLATIVFRRIPSILPLHLHHDIGIIVMLLPAHEGHAIIATGGDRPGRIMVVVGHPPVGFIAPAIHEGFEFGQGRKAVGFVEDVVGGEEGRAVEGGGRGGIIVRSTHFFVVVVERCFWLCNLPLCWC